MTFREETNTEKLTSKYNPSTHKKKIVAEKKEIVFDIKDRKEFLTGFQKRNKEKVKKRADKIKKIEKDALRERRKLKRNKISQAIEDVKKDIYYQEEASKIESSTMKFTDNSVNSATLPDEDPKIATVLIEGL